MAFSCFGTQKSSSKANTVTPLNQPDGNAQVVTTKLPFFYINFKGFHYKIQTHKGCSLTKPNDYSVNTESKQNIDIQLLGSLWKLPETAKLIAMLIGSIESNVHHKTSYDIREFISHLAKFLVRNKSWLLAFGENASFFSCLGHILKNTMFETSETKPAILGVCQIPGLTRHIMKRKNLLWIDQSSILNLKDLDPNINHYIFTTSKKVKIKQSDIFECIFLCNGTAESLEDLKYSLDSHRAVIILKRSGGLADFFADILEIKQKESDVTLYKKIEAAVNYIPLPSKTNTENLPDKTTMLELIKEIVNKMGEQVQILDISKKLEEIKITEVIFKAVHGAEKMKKKSSKQNFIILCLHLDQLEIAAEIGGLWKVVEENDIPLCHLIIKEALLLKRYSFIRYLLEQGLNPNDFIEAEEVSPTYEKMLNAEEKKNDKKMTPKQKRIALLINEFCGNKLTRNSSDKEKEKYDENEASKKTALLFKLSVVEEQINLSKILWQKLDSPTGAALYAYKILKSLRQSEPHLEQKIKIKEWMKEFQNYAIETINRTYNKQPGEAIKLMGQKMDNWGNSTCLMLALTSGNKKFLSQMACREFNNRVWYFGSLIGTKESSHEYTLVPESGNSTDKKCCTLSEEVKDTLRDFFAPSVLASFRYFSHIVFLICFAMYLVSLLHFETLHWIEWLLWTWIGTFFLEQINQLIRNPMKIFPIYPLSLFFLLESVSILLFAVAWGFRLAVYYFPEHTDFMMVARVLFSLDFITFSLFTLEVCCIHSFFGPILLMIMKMFKTLLTFLLIVLIFFGGYAVASESVLYPESSMSPTLAFYLLRKAFWAMFGEFLLDELEGHSCTNDPALYKTYGTLRCPTTTGSYFVPPLMGAYYIIVNVMLFSLLIALFSSTIKKVSNQALEVWHHQSLQMTLKYGKVLILPPPFTIFSPFLWLSISSDDEKPFSKEVTKQNLVNLKKIEVDEQKNFIQYLDVKGSLPVCQCNFVCEHKGSDSNEIKKIYIKDKGSQTDSFEWVPTYGSITAVPVSQRAEKILNGKDKSKDPKKYFAVRTKQKYGIGWKVVSIKKVKKGNSKKVPSEILPDLKYLD